MLDPLLRQLLLLVQPIGFVWFCLLVLTVLLWRKRQRRFALATAGLAVLITLVGSTPLPATLLASLEKPYIGIRLQHFPPVDAVVMLGGGSQPSQRELAGLHLTRAGDRLVTAVELMRLGKAPVLVLGGADAEIDGELRLEADQVKRWLLEWKLPVSQSAERPLEIVTLGRSKDTHDEALKVRAIVAERNWTGVLLVTSASHMRRAEAVFRTAGINVTAAPCDFRTGLSSRRDQSVLSIPSHGGFELFSTWLHEQVGWRMYLRRGWINDARPDPSL